MSTKNCYSHFTETKLDIWQEVCWLDTCGILVTKNERIDRETVESAIFLGFKGYIYRMSTKESQSTQKACYLCGSLSIAKSNNRRAIKFKRIHEYFKCADCKSYSLFPKLKIDELNDLYSTRYIENVSPESNGQEQITENRFLKLQEVLEQTDDKETKRFLDYGCGSGAEVVIFATKLSYKSFGVEVENGTRQEAQKKSGCRIFSPEEVLASGDLFDIIFLGDVLEHLNDPLVTLDQIRTLLTPEGFLIVQGPLEGALTLSNLLLSVKAKMLSKSPSMFPPYHVSLATKDSIAKSLKINKFVLQSIFISEPLWPAPKFGSKASLSSPGSLIFSLAKIFDICISKFLNTYGTRFFLLAKPHELELDQTIRGPLP
jgi:2-polyprenyl-3-methyl-5-hydroxy-6-metoxy-1,4-benzoquinol methylase